MKIGSILGPKGRKVSYGVETEEGQSPLSLSSFLPNLDLQSLDLLYKFGERELDHLIEQWNAWQCRTPRSSLLPFEGLEAI